MNKNARGLICLLYRSKDPNREGELRDWAAEQARTPLAADIPGLVDIRRYQLIPWEMQKPEGPDAYDWDWERSHAGRLASIYESSLDDPTELDAQIRAIGGALPDWAEQVHKGIYRRQVALHPDSYDPNKTYETRGITLALVHPRHSARYETYYVPIHLDEERSHGVYHSVTRYLNLDPDAKPFSCVIEETDWQMQAARAEINSRYLPNFRWPENRKAVLEIYAAADYHRLP